MVFKPRFYFLVGFLFCMGLLAAALYFQFSGGLEPCPLCVSQRIMVFAVALVMLVAVLHNPKRTGVKVYAILGFVMAVLGGTVSARPVWLQHLPPEEVPACGPGLEYMFQCFPLTETLKAMLNGTGDCAKVDWTLLGLSMPAWVLISFFILALLSLTQFWNSSAVRGDQRYFSTKSELPFR
ncbi:MAG: disulfide bond formation protein B [Methylocaldum sp.]|nr:disulfide bond formation protein B [Methylocaldum sp.]